jgi:hypothetical protein
MQCPKSMLNKVLSILSFVLLSTPLVSQNTFAKEIEFIEYLAESEMYSEAHLALDILQNTDLNTLQQDSVSFYKAVIYYTEKKLDSAIKAFDKVSINSELSKKAQAFSIISMLYTRKYDAALIRLDEFPADSEMLKSWINFEKAGTYLLARNYDMFDKYSSTFKGEYYYFAKQEKSLQSISNDCRDKKRKSKFLAAVMSILIPGSGKIYSAKAIDGIVAFFATAMFYTISIENYLNGGFSNPQFYLFATLGVVFHYGSIIGSIKNVDIKNYEFNTGVNDKILFDLHIPIRSIFQ